MRHQKNHFLLGIFVITGIFLIGGAITLLGAKAAFTPGVAVESYFREPVTGLERGSPVRFRGVEAGKVTKITTTRAEYGQGEENYALVRCEVHPEVLGIAPERDFQGFLRERIRNGLRMQLTETNITGSVHIRAVYVEGDEEDATLDHPWKPRAHYVPATTSTLETFKVSFQEVLEQLKRVDLVGVAEAAKATFARIDRVLGETDVAGLSKQARATLDSADKLLAKPELHKAIDDAGEAAAGFRKLVQRADHTVLAVRRALGTRDLAAITDGLRELVDNLNSLSSMLERHPSLAVFGKPPQPVPVDATTKQPGKKP